MALQSIFPTRWPGNCIYINSTGPLFSNAQQLNAAGEYDSIIFSACKDFTCTQVEFYINAVASAGTVEARLETVDATNGRPSGTLVATNTNGTSGTISAAGWVTVALTASASLVRGTKYAVKLAWASGDLTTTRVANHPTGEFPYNVANGGSPVKQNYTMVFALYDGSEYLPVPRFFPCSAITTSTFSNATTSGSGGDERGVRFQVPFKCRAIGLTVFDISPAAGDFDILITDDSGTELSSSATANDGDVQQGSAGPIDYFFDNSVTLDPATWYRAWIRPTSTTSTAITYLTLNSDALKTALPGGLNWDYCFRTDAGAADDTNSARYPMMDIIVDQLDDGVGGAGGLAANPIGGFVA